MYRLLKRLLDLVAASSALLLLGAVMLVVALAVARKLGRPVLFRQRRAGLDEAPFDILKFRTMTDARGPDGALLPDDQRLTPFGAWLRASSLDELPSLLNVLRGEMSLVGPRPLPVRYLPRYSADQRRRHEVPPGLTGHAQVNGRNALSWDSKFALDLWYVENRSLLLDLRILLATVKKVVARSDIAAAGEATMTEFMGSPAGSSRPSDGA